jgi:hypothetical protein
MMIYGVGIYPDELKAIGGRAFEDFGKVRVYLDVADLVHLVANTKKCGAVRSYTLAGVRISNDEAERILRIRVWGDESGLLRIRGADRTNTVSSDHILAAVLLRLNSDR